MAERTLIDIYGDESCHLERDGHDLMVLGAVSVPHARARELADAIRHEPSAPASFGLGH